MGELGQMAVTAAEREAILWMRGDNGAIAVLGELTLGDLCAARTFRFAGEALPVPDVHNADGSFATISGEPVENDATRIARELQRDIHRHAGEAALVGLFLAARITLAINAALARAQGKPVVIDHCAFPDGSVAERIEGETDFSWRVVREGNVHAPPHEYGLAHQFCAEANEP